MAGNSATKSRNQAFLEQHERQRLNKPCNRTIDLRSKVPGECLAYQFGGKTHYLDDRGYLIAKQLLDRFKGKYTVGVYEALLKALKTLSANDDTEAEKELEFILKRNRSDIQLIPFENQLQRKESRIIFATPVDIHRADVLYHGSTIDITSSAISVVLKRVSTLEKGDNVLVSFPELSSDVLISNLLTSIPYSVLAIEHDNLRTRLILLRNRNDDCEVTEQLDNWCKQHNSPDYLDLDNELFNLACHYYQHLFCHTLASPQIWLNPQDSHNSIQAFQITSISAPTIELLRMESEFDFSLLPINEMLTNQGDFLIQISSQQVCLAHRSDPAEVASLLQKHRAQQSSSVLLITLKNINISLESFKYEIAQIAKDDIEYASTLEQRLGDISLLASITNISASCSMLETSTTRNNTTAVEGWQGTIPFPTEFKYAISRKHPRYLIHTPIRIHVNTIKFEASTCDVSISGLALTLQGDIALSVGSRVFVDFIRWQQQTSSIKLTKISYHIRNIQFWNGETHIGLERDIRGSTPNINTFFESTINRNKKKLSVDNHDIITCQESEIFGSLLSQNIASVPFYLGMDDDHKRIIQAAISTHNSLDSTFWQSFQRLVTMMSEQLNLLPNNATDSVHFGIYCARDNEARWQIMTEHDFSSSHEKSLFINRSFTQQQRYFFHCRLTPIKFTWFEQEAELNRQLIELRNHSPHKVKQIKSIMLSLFAIGELTDITDIITASYHHIINPD